jgi:long-chain acyl-CoA synthetase
MNLANMLVQGARCFPEKKALIYGKKSYTYGELNSVVDRVALYLRDLGVTPEQRVSIYLPNIPEWPMFYYAIARLGAVAVCIAAAYKRDEMTRVVNDSLSSVVVTCEELLPHLPDRSVIPHVRDVIVIERDAKLQSILEGGKAIPGSPLRAHMVCYHERTVPGDVGICFMPLNHVFGLCHIMNSIFYGCATLVLFKGFDMDAVMASVAENKITRFYAVPTIYIRFLNNPASKASLKSLTYVFSAATSMPEEIVRQWHQEYGLAIHESYGMTESASIVTFNHYYRHKVGAVGVAAGLAEIKLVDREDKEVGLNETGEIVIRSPNIMKGYFNQPEETATAMRNGWFHSGDVGRFDEEGYLYIVDRIKDVIITGGENVFPREVEEVLYTHEAINECAVVGWPHPEYGEAVTAFVTLKQGQTAEEEPIIRFCKERLARYKVPKKVHIVNELPKSPQGKILRRELRKK